MGSGGFKEEAGKVTRKIDGEGINGDRLGLDSIYIQGKGERILLLRDQKFREFRSIRYTRSK